jgi:hypothetical protein
MASALMTNEESVIGSPLNTIPLLKCRNSSADTTHSFSRDGRSLEKMFTAVAGGLQSLEVDNCNDIFTQKTFEDLPLLTQLKKLHISSCRQRLLSCSFDYLGSLSDLQVGLRDNSLCLHTVPCYCYT